MSKKNSSVSLNNGFKDYKDLSKVFLNFSNKINKLNKKKYVVAVSGGPDSLGLVALTKAYAYQKKIKFYYVLVDHSIRKNSHREAIQVKKLLKKYKINLKIFTNKKEITKNIQAEARNARYEILFNHCKKIKVNALLTAHNMEDQVETFLIRLSRGSGIKGLSAMKSVNKINSKLSLCRPLLDIKKDSLIKISKNIFGRYFKDPSNNNKKYLRTKIRNLKDPLLKSGISYDQIMRSINNLASSKETLDKYIEGISKNLIKKSRNEILIDLRKFHNLNLEIKLKIINESIKKLKKNYYDPRSRKVINLIKNIESRKDHKATLGGCIFLVKKDQLRLKREKQ